MFGSLQPPLDKHPYPKSADSRPLTNREAAGQYVYVVDSNEIIHVAPDDFHKHPKGLGLASLALYAGDMTIASPGIIGDITNLSGTFQFSSKSGLCCVKQKLQEMGFTVMRTVWHDWQNGAVPRILSC